MLFFYGSRSMLQGTDRHLFHMNNPLKLHTLLPHESMAILFVNNLLKHMVVSRKLEMQSILLFFFLLQKQHFRNVIFRIFNPCIVDWTGDLQFQILFSLQYSIYSCCPIVLTCSCVTQVLKNERWSAGVSQSPQSCTRKWVE